ncbi:MAG TPA: MFS transporter [Limnochorda sp.]
MNPWALVALCSVPFVMVLGNSMLIPVLPALQQALDISAVQVGLLITAFSVPAGLLIPVAGALSDQYGRKIIMVPALILYGAGGLLAGAAALWLNEPFPYILGARVVQGMGAGGTYQLAMTLAGDLLPPGRRARALGLLETSNGAGKVASPLLGSLLGVVAWFAPFFFYGALAIPAALAVWGGVPEGPPKGQRFSQYFSGLKSVAREKGISLLGAYLAGAVSLFLLFGALATFSDQAEAVYGLRHVWKGLALAVPVTGSAACAYVAGRWLAGKPERVQPTLLAGLSLAGAALAAVPFVHGLFPRLATLLFLGAGVGTALTPANTAVTGAVGAARRGAITCLYGSMRFFGVALGPPTFSLMMESGWSSAALYWAGALLAWGTAAAAALAFRPGRLVARFGQGPSEA